MAKDDKKASDETASASAPVVVATPKPAAATVQEPVPVEAVTKPALVQLETSPTSAPATAKQAFKVWSYGTLQRNGTIHRPGDVLHMTPEEAAKIPCLEPAT
jgi:hypothetical protein